MNKFVLMASAVILYCGNISESSAECVGATETTAGTDTITGVHCGICGTNCNWKIEGDTLKVTGGADGSIGTMDDYDKACGGEGHNTQWTGLNIRAIYVSGLENIGIQAFRDLKKVEKITISDSVERVGAGAFDNASMLQYVDFGDAVTSIGAFAIQDSKSLIQIIVPDTLNNIYTIK